MLWHITWETINNRQYMNNYKFGRRLLAVMSAFVLAIGCVENPQPDPAPTPTPPPAPPKDPVVTLAAASTDVSAQAGTGTLSISIENAVSGETAKASSDASWLAVTGTTNSSVAYRYDENTLKDSRSANITVSYGKAQAKVFTVRQAGAVVTEEPKTPHINLMAPNVKLAFSGGQFELQLQIENPSEGAKLDVQSSEWWIKIDSVSDDKVVGFCDANYTDEARSGVITLSYPGAESQTVTIEQGSIPLPPWVNVLTEKVNVPAEGGNFEILLKVDNPAEGVHVVLESAPDWIKIESVSDEKIVGSCQANPHDYTLMGSVDFYYEGAAHYSVSVWQEAGKGTDPEPQKPVIRFAYDEANFPFREIYFNIGYYIENPHAGADIDVKSDQEWLEVERIEGGYIYCVARANTGPKRTGILTVTYPDAAAMYFPVTQEGVPDYKPVIMTSIPQDRYNASWKGEQYYFEVSAAGMSAEELYLDLRAGADSPWIYVHVLQAEKRCRLDVEPNYEKETRTAHFTMSYGDYSEPKVIEVTQGGEELYKPWIYVNENLWDNLSNRGGSMWLVYSVANSDSVSELTCRSDQPWLTVSEKTRDHIEINYDKNPYGEERTAHLTLSYPGADDVTVTFRQEAYKYLKPVITLGYNSFPDASYTSRSHGLSYTIENFTELSLLKITSDSDWIKIGTYNESYLEYFLDENPDYTTRTGHITVSYEGADDAVLTITQEPQPRWDYRIQIDEHTKYHPQQGTENGVTRVTIIYPWDEYQLTATSSNDEVCHINNVVLVKQYEDIDEYEVRYTVSANPTHSDRNAYITLKYGDLTHVLAIEQFSTEKPVINPETNKIHVPFSGVIGHRFRYEITNPAAGAKLTVDSKASWIKTASITDYEIFFNVDPNSDPSARSATVYLKYADADPVGITFEQDPWVPDPFFSFVDQKVTMNKFGDLVTVKINLENFDVNDFSSFSISSGWAAVDGYDFAKKTMTIRAEQNTTGADRELDFTVTLTLKSGKKLSSTIKIVQQARDLILSHDKNEVNVNSEENTVVIRFTPETRFDDYVSVKGAPGWITTSRSGDNITLKIAKNYSAAGRSATLVFSYHHHADVYIPVTQKGISENLPADVVDLGLPSGKLWTTMNMGASKPSDSGTFYAWGEIGGKSSYTWDNYMWKPDQMKYDETGTLEMLDDPAARFLSFDYRMPTIYDFIELEENCNLAEETLNGVKGLRISNKKDSSKSIFIPYTGYMDSTAVKGKGNGLSLWTNSRYGNKLEAVMVIGDSEQISGAARERYLGAPIRPVFSPYNP